MGNPTYYILQGEDVTGPFTLSQVCAKWKAGELARETLYSEEGYNKWLQLSILMDEDEAARAATEEAAKASRFSGSRFYPRAGWIHRMEGVAGVLELFEDKLTITSTGVMGLLSKGLKGTKTIPFFSITAIQFKRAGLTSGYLQFTIPGGNESRGGLFEAAGDENTFMFSDRDENNRFAELMKEYVERRVGELRYPRASAQTDSGSLADELRKLAQLKSEGVLSEAEFEAAKKRLLG